jgi:hypothetical protein
MSTQYFLSPRQLLFVPRACFLMPPCEAFVPMAPRIQNFLCARESISAGWFRTTDAAVQDSWSSAGGGGTTANQEGEMKNTVRYFMVLAISAMALSTFSMAQEVNDRVTAKIPFSFYAEGQHFPAGPYEFVLNEQDDTVTLANVATGRSEMMLALPADAEGYGNPVDEGFVRPVVGFDLYDGSHVLSDLRTDTNGVNFFIERPEIASAQHGESAALDVSGR